MGTQDLAKKEDTVKISLQSPGKVLETAKALSEIQDPITKESTHNSVNCSTSALQYTADFIRKIDNTPQTTPNLEIQSLLKEKSPLRRLTSSLHRHFQEEE